MFAEKHTVKTSKLTPVTFFADCRRYFGYFHLFSSKKSSVIELKEITDFGKITLVVCELIRWRGGGGVEDPLCNKIGYSESRGAENGLPP